MSPGPRTHPALGPGWIALLFTLHPGAPARASTAPPRVLFYYAASQAAQALEMIAALRDLLPRPVASLRDRAAAFELPESARGAFFHALQGRERASLVVWGEFSSVQRFFFFWKDRQGGHLTDRALPSSQAGPHGRAEALSLIIRSLLDSQREPSADPAGVSRSEAAGWSFAVSAGYRALHVAPELVATQAGFVSLEASPHRPWWLRGALALHAGASVHKSQVSLSLKPWELRLLGGLAQQRGRLFLGVQLGANVAFWAWEARSDLPGFHQVPGTLDWTMGLEGSALLGARVLGWLDLVIELGLQLPLIRQGFSVESIDQPLTILTPSWVNPSVGLGLRVPFGR